VDRRDFLRVSPFCGRTKCDGGRELLLLIYHQNPPSFSSSHFRLYTPQLHASPLLCAYFSPSIDCLESQACHSVMAIPLSFLRDQYSQPPPQISLGDHLAARIDQADHVDSLLDCLPSTSRPAILSPDPSRPPLAHDEVHSFIQHFFLPNSTAHRPLGPNDRIMIVLPTGPENALALMALATYHTCAPVNASCTAQELREDAERLRAKAVVATRDVEERLELAQLREELGCDVVFVEPRTSGPAGLFDMDVMGTLDTTPRRPSRPHGLDDQSLVLHTSGTSGKKKVVPYSLRSLIVGTWAVVDSWNLTESDVNSK
jgi:hypothetical protein